MSELSVIPTRYSSMNPWLDISPFLINGWRAVYYNTALVSLNGNYAYWAVMLNGDDASDVVIAEGLPESVRGPTTTPLSGSLRSHSVELRLTSRIYFTGSSATKVGHELSGTLAITGVTPRRSTV